MAVLIEPVSFTEKFKWEQFVNVRNDTSFVDYFQWSEAIHKTYSLNNYWYTAKINGKIEGIIALTHARHPFFGSYLSTAPFGSCGGFYANTEEVSDSLIKKAEELKNNLGAKYVLIRHKDGDKKPPAGWVQKPIYRSFHIPTNLDSKTLLNRVIPKSGRYQIKRSLKSGYTFKFGSWELFEPAWDVFLNGMKYLGSPYHSKNFLCELKKLFANNLNFAVAYDRYRTPLAAFLCIQHKNTLSPVHGGMIRQHGDSYVGVFLMWSIIDHCCSKGIKILDLGRSLIGSPNEHFKEKFQPVKKNLAYWYYIDEGMAVPELNQNNSLYGTFRIVWRKLPTVIHKKIGPFLIKGIL